MLLRLSFLPSSTFLLSVLVVVVEGREGDGDDNDDINDDGKNNEGLSTGGFQGEEEVSGTGLSSVKSDGLLMMGIVGGMI